MRLDKADGCSIQKNLENLIKNTVYWCNLKLAQERGLQFYHTRSHAIVLYSTRESGMHEGKECVIPKGTLTPRVPRVVLQPNSQIGLQDER